MRRPADAGDLVSDVALASGGGDERAIALVSAILGAGRPSAASQAASRRLLRRLGGFEALGACSLEEARRAGRISLRQALALRASFLLGRELASLPLRPGERFTSSRELFLRYRARFVAANREYFLSLHLNAKNQLIREVVVSVGSLSASVVHPREVFSPAVRDSSAALIFLHNHPSGDPAPSREDHDCTDRLVRAGRILGIRVLDHIVLGREAYFSFADSGLVEAH
jgi:DNA repair protein RadC